MFTNFLNSFRDVGMLTELKRSVDKTHPRVTGGPKIRRYRVKGLEGHSLGWPQGREDIHDDIDVQSPYTKRRLENDDSDQLWFIGFVMMLMVVILLGAGRAY